MASQHAGIKIPLNKVLVVLIGFPVFSTLISLLLLKRDIFEGIHLPFFPTLWVIITVWYAIQILVVKKILQSEGYSFSDVGYAYNKRKTTWFVLGFLTVAIGLTVFIEMALKGNAVDPDRLSDFSNLSPKTTLQRSIFIAMALVGGMSEELVYRCFAIRALQGFRINKWISAVMATIPFVFQHGLKSIDQFWWFFIMGLLLSGLFVALKKIYVNIIIHWLIILSAMLAILSVIQ